jgi:hypothetical protein
VIRIVHCELPLGLRVTVTREHSVVVITVSTRLIPSAQRSAVRTGIAAARRAGWLRRRVPAVVLIGPASWLADRLSRIHAAAAATAAVAAAGMVVVAGSSPAVHVASRHAAPLAGTPSGHGATRPRVGVPAPRTPGRQSHRITAVPHPSAQAPRPQPTSSPLVAPATSPAVTVTVSPSPTCLHLTVLGVCAGL